MSYIVCVPITDSTQKYYDIEMKYFRENPHWCSTKSKRECITDYFAFVFQSKEKNIMYIYKIENIINYNEGKREWWDNTHSNCDVLVMSKCIHKLKWSKFKKLNNNKENFSLRGCQRLTLNFKILTKNYEELYLRYKNENKKLKYEILQLQNFIKKNV